MVRCVAVVGRSTLFSGRPTRYFVTGVTVKWPVLIPRVHGVFCAAICCSLSVEFKFWIMYVCVCFFNFQVIFAHFIYVVFFQYVEVFSFSVCSYVHSICNIKPGRRIKIEKITPRILNLGS